MLQNSNLTTKFNCAACGKERLMRHDNPCSHLKFDGLTPSIYLCTGCIPSLLFDLMDTDPTVKAGVLRMIHEVTGCTTCLIKDVIERHPAAKNELTQMITDGCSNKYINEELAREPKDKSSYRYCFEVVCD
jgi:hypothetical protein